MNDRMRKAFLMWSYREDFKGLIMQSLDLIRRCVKDSEKCVVAYSGGKDSTVLLHLALQVDPAMDVFLWDQGQYLMPREVHAEICGNAKKVGAQNFIVESAPIQNDSELVSSPFLWGVSHRAHYAVICRLKRERGWVTQFVGLRSEESCSRKRVCGKPRWGEVYPLDRWGWRDVWAYIVSNNLPYPQLYDVYCPLLGWDRARFVNFFSKRFENFGNPYLDGFFFPQYKNMKKEVKDKLDRDLTKAGLMPSDIQFERYLKRHNIPYSKTEDEWGGVTIIRKNTKNVSDQSNEAEKV